MYTQDELNAAVAAALEKVADDVYCLMSCPVSGVSDPAEIMIHIRTSQRDTSALDKYKKDAERWRFVMNKNKYAGALWDALPLEIWGNNIHLNNAIDEAMEKDGK